MASASSPTASTLFWRVSTATMLGWLSTTPLPSIAIMIDVVPRSMPISLRAILHFSFSLLKIYRKISYLLLNSVAAAHTPNTPAAPAFIRVPAQAESVVPVVITSSTSRMYFPSTLMPGLIA